MFEKIRVFLHFESLKSKCKEDSSEQPSRGVNYCRIVFNDEVDCIQIQFRVKSTRLCINLALFQEMYNVLISTK